MWTDQNNMPQTLNNLQVADMVDFATSVNSAYEQKKSKFDEKKE